MTKNTSLVEPATPAFLRSKRRPMDTFTTELPEGITLTQPFSTRDLPTNEPVFLPAHYVLPTVGSTEFDAITTLSPPESELIAAYDLALPFQEQSYSLITLQRFVTLIKTTSLLK